MHSIAEYLPHPIKQLNPAEYREWITLAEDHVREEYDAVDAPDMPSNGFTLKHGITPGLYTRTLTMPAGWVIFSKVHMHTTPFVVLSGMLSVYDGTEMKNIVGPYSGVTLAGTKRVLLVHEESVWMTFHPTELTEIEEIEKSGVIACETFEQFDKFTKLLDDKS